MSSTPVKISTKAVAVTVTVDTLMVDLEDGRTISVPIVWYPRLFYGTPQERSNWRFIGKGVGIHWPDLDEDIEVQGLLDGCKSGESPSSLRRWLDSRSKKHQGA